MMTSVSPISNYSAIIEGFKADCARLLKLFVESEQYDFNTFIQIWQNMKFSLIFCNCSLPELKLYSSHIFLVVKSYLTTDNFSTLGPFYLLYALYYKQPTRSALIRMTKEEMESLMKLTDEYASCGYYLPAFMLAKLQSEHAFYYTADSQVFAMDNHFEKKFNTCDFKRGGNNVDIQADFITGEIIDSEWYKKWKVREDKYNKLKAEIVKGEERKFKKSKKDPDASLNHILAPTNLLDDLQITIEDSVDNKEQDYKSQSASTSDSIGQSRVNLKAKIFKAPVIFDKYDKKDVNNAAVVNEASCTPADCRNPQITKKNTVGKWKHYLKDAINQGKQQL